MFLKPQKICILIQKKFSKLFNYFLIFLDYKDAIALKILSK